MSTTTKDTTKLPPANDSDSDSEGEDEKPKASSPKSTTKDGGAEKPEGERYDRLERLKREKRLAQNRDCARARRRRKKLRMELLENRVQELTTNNKTLQQENDALTLRVTQLEGQLRQAQQFRMNTGGMPGGMLGAGAGAGGFGGAGVPPPNAFLSGMGGGTGVGGIELDLQRRAAMVGLGGATTGLGGAAFGAGGPTSADTMRYLQLMQFKNQGQNTAAGN